MRTDALTPVSWRARPRSFVALMALYESNHVRLGWLLPDPESVEGRRVSRVEGDCELVLTVVERARYTSTLNLTYWLEERDAAHAVPDIRLRVYHDARLVEAVEWARGHEHGALQAMRRAAERELDQRWARNVMLNKWLEYCAERGHRFAPPARE
jgi:hypothetical protein